MVLSTENSGLSEDARTRSGMGKKRAGKSQQSSGGHRVVQVRAGGEARHARSAGGAECATSAKSHAVSGSADSSAGVVRLRGSNHQCSLLHPDLEHLPKVKTGGLQPVAQEPHFRHLFVVAPSAADGSAAVALGFGARAQGAAARVPFGGLASFRAGGFSLRGQAVAEAVVGGAGGFRQGCRLAARSTHELTPIGWARVRRRRQPLSCPLMGICSRSRGRLHASSVDSPSISYALVVPAGDAARGSRVKGQERAGRVAQAAVRIDRITSACTASASRCGDASNVRRHP